MLEKFFCFLKFCFALISNAQELATCISFRLFFIHFVNVQDVPACEGGGDGAGGPHHQEVQQGQAHHRIRHRLHRTKRTRSQVRVFLVYQG